jgi:hypothetical protein
MGDNHYLTAFRPSANEKNKSHNYYFYSLAVSQGQPTMGCPPAWELDVGLTTYRRKKISFLQKA